MLAVRISAYDQTGHAKVYSAEHPLQFRAWRGSSILQWESLGPNAQLGIENERLDRYGYARQDFANLNRRVRLMQVAHGARENSRHTGTAAPRPATEVDRHRMLLGKFK